MSNEHEWLNLVEISGPFLAVPVLREVFPQGLQALASGRAQRLRQAYEEWRDAVELHDADLSALHLAWIDEVLTGALETSAEVLRRGSSISDRLKIAMPEHGITLAPDLALVSPTRAEEPLLLIHVLPPDTDLEATQRFEGLATTPSDRMVMLLRAADCPMGLVTNGERWMLVHAPTGAVAGFSSWYARLWGQEPETLRAFVSLLGVRRFFGPDSEKLPALYERSLKYQDDVTDALGEQVRRAVEVLVQSLDRADQDRNRELLHDVDPRELYDAGLTVMMRLVFLLAAEERGLLLLGDPRYDSYYAISSLRMQLRADSEEVLERRRSGWSRLLALFRAVFGGIDHPTLRLPALGGSLFDPDRYPFLEGRKKGTSWRTQQAEPLPIDDRTVLLLLEAIQTFEGRTLSYRALDVEQIGHVYEGLLERTVKRVDDITLELESSAKAKNPRVTLGELDSARLDGPVRVAELLKERSERSDSAIRNGIARDPDERLGARLLTVCRGDPALRDRILPYAHLLRTDPWGYPLVHHAGAFVVVLGTDRRESGTHYTPKSLTEKIVEETLVPVVYRGPAEGKTREEWELKSADEILDLKVCDPAMGSGAFLVQACRWLADRLVESWASEESRGNRVDDAGRVHRSDDKAAVDLLSPESEERAILARRLVAERCLYGVDKNPLAVELAKLSLWLTTLAKGRPFGFLDHNLRSGDSLLGIRDLAQLIELDMSPQSTTQPKLFGRTIRDAVDRAITLRGRLREIPIRDIRDVEAMAALDAQSRAELQLPQIIADAFVGIIFAEPRASERAAQLQSLAALADQATSGSVGARETMLHQARRGLAKEAPDNRWQQPFHWPIEFPEVFDRANGGFDAIVGNPPFLGGRRMRAALGGAMLEWLQELWPHSSLNADLCSFFFLTANQIVRAQGSFGYLATKTIAQGDTARTGLAYLLNQKGCVIRTAISSFPWPGSASVVASLVIIQNGNWNGVRSLNGQNVGFVSAILDDQEGWGRSGQLHENSDLSFQGSVLVGLGFVLTNVEAENFIATNPENSLVVFPYLSGDDLNSSPDQRASRWAIDFRDRPLEECQTRWPELTARIQQLVKPQRDLTRRAAHRNYWWHHGDKRPALYARLNSKTEVFAIARVTKYVAIVKVPCRQVFHDKVYILDLPNWSAFAALQSTFHDAWCRRGSSTVGMTLNYTPSDYFDTYPFIHLHTNALNRLGQLFHQTRQQIMQRRKIGLTDVYNEFNDPAVSDPDIDGLRQLQRKMDSEVAREYGWSDLSLDHDFRQVQNLPESDRVRFTIAEDARTEVLRRLEQLNRQRFAAEVEQGLHGPAGSNHTRISRRSRASSLQQSSLVFLEDDTEPVPES